MAENSGGNAFLGVIVGALLILVVVGGVYFATGGNFAPQKELSVKVEAPQLPSTN